MARRFFAHFSRTKEDEADLVCTSNADRAGSLTENIARGIEQISQNVSELETLIGQPESPRDSKDHRDRILQLSSSTKHIAKDTSEDLKEFFQLQPSPIDPNAQQHIEEQKEKLRATFCTVLEGLKTVEHAALEKQRASFSGSDVSHASENDWVLLHSRDFQQTLKGYKLSNKVTEEMPKAREELAMMQEREQEISELEGDIKEVNQIFKDFRALVHDQGDVLASIEANMEHAEIHVLEGTQQLDKTRDYQARGGRRRKTICCCICGVLSILTIVGIVLAIVVNRLFLIMPTASILGIIGSVVCFKNEFKLQFKFKSSQTDIKLKAKGNKAKIKFDFKGVSCQ